MVPPPRSAAASPRAAFFDVDRTLLRGSSLLALARPLRRAGLISTRLTARALARQLRFGARGMSNPEIEAAVASLSDVIRGLDAGEVRRITDASLADVVLPRIYEEARRLLGFHQRRGDRIFLVSASPHELVDGLGALLGADGVVATDAEIVDGRYTGRIKRLAHGTAKADAVRELATRFGIDLAASSAYGDSLSDLPMLELVGHPVAVNADRRLAVIAAARGWRQLHFHHRGLVARLTDLRRTPVAASVSGTAPIPPARPPLEIHR
jgi:HAD superfamily hydrolase (TIGR01490 family)